MEGILNCPSELNFRYDLFNPYTLVIFLSLNLNDPLTFRHLRLPGKHPLIDLLCDFLDRVSLVLTLPTLFMMLPFCLFHKDVQVVVLAVIDWHALVLESLSCLALVEVPHQAGLREPVALVEWT